MANVVIYGNGQTAELALARIRRDSDHTVVGFTVDRPYCTSDSLHGLPVVPFDEVAQRWAPADHLMFVAVGHARVNRVRAERFAAAMASGYGPLTLISPRADVWPGVEIGDNCLIGDGCSVLPFSRIGDNVHLSTGCIVSHHCIIEDHCFFAPAVALAGSVTVGHHAFLGTGVMVRDGTNIGASCFIGAGVAINSDTAESSVYAVQTPTPLPVTSDRLPVLRPRNMRPPGARRT